MIERKPVNEKRRCPHCESTIDRLSGRDENDKNVWKMDCPNCGDITEAYVDAFVKRRWKDVQDDSPPSEAFKCFGKTRRKCANCLTVYGHPVAYCQKCNGKTDLLETVVTMREWLKRAPNAQEREKRFRSGYVVGTLQVGLAYPELDHVGQVDKVIEILGLTFD